MEARRSAQARSSAISSSPLRISRAISVSIRKQRYAMRTRNSCAASATSKTLWPGMGGKPKTRRSKRWIGSGTRRRPRRRKGLFRGELEPGRARQPRKPLPLLGRDADAERGHALAHRAPRDHLAVFVDPMRERALLGLERDLDRLASEIEPALDLGAQRIETVAGRGRDEHGFRAPRFALRAGEGRLIEKVGL